MPLPVTMTERWLVDGHVHFYPCFNARAFLDSAADNFARNASRLGTAARSGSGILLFTDTAESVGYRFFLHAASRDGAIGEWRLRQTSEDCSLVAERGGSDRLFMIRGRQISTSRGLEVLALATAESFEEGLGLRETVERVHRSGALPVIPWGFGKFWFRRGREVEKVLCEESVEEVFVSDNRNRTIWLPRSSILSRVRQSGQLDLPGTDPLPFEGFETAVGSYGFVLNARRELDSETPATSFRREVRRLEEQPDVFGRRIGLAPFVRSQILLQVR